MAFKDGYRVTENGVFLNPKKEIMQIKVYNEKNYPTFKYRSKEIEGTIPIHKFAAYCFYGEDIFKEGLVVRHLISDKQNVSKSNIALGTHKDNTADIPNEIRERVMNLATEARRGIRGWSASFSDDEVREIKRRLKNGEFGTTIAKEYGVSKSTIYEIKYGRSYADVE
jgi:hypothetical protein